MPSWSSVNFQDAGSSYMLELGLLHDYILIVMVVVMLMVTYILTLVLVTSYYYKFLSESTFMEMIWSITPAFILIILVTPSMKILYILEDVSCPVVSAVIIGHQWYWSYMVPTSLNFGIKGVNYFTYDSMMTTDSPRLLSCDTSLILPSEVFCRLMVSSSDVIHAFSVPSLGLKVDAVPGRLNQIFLLSNSVGVYFGQCSEICGSYHSFMPIKLEVMKHMNFSYFSYSFTLDYYLTMKNNIS